MLHTLINSPYQIDLDILLQMINISDDVLLLQDGVISVIIDSIILNKFKNIITIISVLKEDVIARDLSTQITNQVKMIDYNGFIELTTKHSQQMIR